MKIGLYFGSFNPIHHGHLIIANHILNHGSVDQVWFVVSPQNPHKPSGTLLNEYHRLYLVQLAIEGCEGLVASDIEFKLPRPSYTIDTLTYLSEKYPQHQFKVVMGSDSFRNLSKWKNYEILIRDYSFIIYERPGFQVETIPSGADITVLKAPLLEISATHIRNTIKEGKSVQFLVPDKVREEMERNSYYK
ncbi:MAG: nicotinate-nucleotide adenylyltransferase [Chitinophagaceae bacterium]|jgi:nicotinate-nucleotide adenylyltransferase|nr:nicotinate-nucleotide adenylyltransferase [Chitinophagaceae bacterium]